MRTIKLVIEYDGTNYAGWQLQPNGVSVQQVLEEAYQALIGEPVRLHSSGRTDAGVHARGMVAMFRTGSSIPVRAFCYGVNTLLPPDIAVRSAEEADADFHPRRDARGKFYRYTIHHVPIRSPLSRQSAWCVRGPLDLAAMGEAAQAFVGENDFAAFRASGCAAKTTIRRVHAVDVVVAGEFIHLDVRGEGFLRNMVRIMVGTLVAVGQGKLTLAGVRQLLSGSGRAEAGVTAPPHGLCLMEVYY